MKPTKRLSSVHFVGIGGAGMSAIAEILQHSGFKVSGSDATASAMTDYLKSIGMDITIGHGKVPHCDTLVYSSAISKDNPERIEARKRGIPEVRRAEMLGELMRQEHTLAVSGTHGKTTTTSMLGEIWLVANCQPTLLVGGVVSGKTSGAVIGSGQYLIAEADEYDRSFLAMWPSSLIITNIDADHLDIYKDLAEIQAAFVSFTRRLPFHGLSIVNGDDAGVAAVLDAFAGKVVTFGLGENNYYQAIELPATEKGSSFDLYKEKEKLGRIDLSVYGTHNIYNATAAAALSLEEGISFGDVLKGLEQFQGVKRRMEFIGEKNGIRVFDDYAHHPTELLAMLMAAKKITSQKVIAVFQPHLYSRTRLLQEEFAQALMHADQVFVTKIYPSREQPEVGVEGDLIVKHLLKFGYKNVTYVDNLDGLDQNVSAHASKGDLIVTVGAGSIGQLAPLILRSIK